MRISKILAYVFLVLCTISVAQNLTTTVTNTSGTSLEILTNWQLTAILAIIISVILVAIGYAIGIGFEMPEMEAWARSELTQVFANVIIVIALIGTVAFIDTAVLAMVKGSGAGGIDCNPGENCLNKTATAYLDDYINASRDGALNVVRNNMDASAWANRRVGLYCYTIYCAQAGVTTTVAGQYMLDSDRYQIVFEYYQGLLSSLIAQKFFINEISFKIGPLILALGIVGRTFFFSRKLGGLLIAIAAGIMFFFPAMFIFDWMTLDMTLNGDKGLQGEVGTCPIECGYAAPLAFYYNNTLGKDVLLNSTSQVYAVFPEDQGNIARRIVLGNQDSAPGINGITVYSCEKNTTAIEGAQPSCDRSCRELPYPSGSNLCANYSMQLSCSVEPEQCKVTRLVAKIEPEEQKKCPTECRMVPPLKSDCNVKADGVTAGGNCLASRFDCRVAKYTDLNWRPSIDSGLKGAEKCNDYPHVCVADSTDATKSCTWVIPEFGSCEDLCAGCPEECRFTNPSDVSPDAEPQCYDQNKNYLSACTNAKCSNSCKLDITQINAIPNPENKCSACPANHRILPSVSVLDANYTTDIGAYKCSLDTSCPADYRLRVPASACEQCVQAEEQYTYNPPINMNCGDLCKPSDNTPSKTSGDYSKIDQDGLVGREEIKNVSKLLVPGYLLPLFNIAATITVIMALSAMLGGDIEIPGLGKIF